MKLKLKKPIVIEAGTVLESDGVQKIVYCSEFVCHTLGFGRNATGSLRIGTEVGDKEFDEWFEEVK